MRTSCFPLAAALALVVAYPSQAAKKPHPARASQSPSNQSPSKIKKVWTNEDLEQLRDRPLISIVGQEPTGAAAQAPAPTVEVFPVYESRLDDPEWYRSKATELQGALDDAMGALQQEVAALAQAQDRNTAPGVALDKPSVGVTPDAALALLQAHVDDVQMQLDELSDLARQHDIDPGVLRS